MYDPSKPEVTCIFLEIFSQVDQTQPSYMSKAVIHPYLSAEQFLTSLSTAASNELLFPENLRLTPDMISKNQPTAEKTPFSRNLEKSTSQLFGKKVNLKFISLIESLLTTPSCY